MYNNAVSYGLWEFKLLPPFNTVVEGIIMIRRKLSGEIQFTAYAGVNDNVPGCLTMTPKRTPDNGFLLLRGNPITEPASVCKINRYGLVSWGTTFLPYYFHEANSVIDITADGGCVVAGYYDISYPASQSIMNVIRMNSAGETGGCAPSGINLFTDTLGCWERPFVWNNRASFIPGVLGPVSSATRSFANTINNLCSSSICIDKTPLPPGCDKTYRIEYSAEKPTVFRDVVSTIDGGKIAVGDMQQDGLMVKFGINGDVVWSKRYEEYFHNMMFMRVLRTPDNNLMVFANNYKTINHEASSTVRMAKMDNNGNILWARELGGDFSALEQELGDVVQTPDGGFIIVINDDYGSGGIFTYVIRGDGNGNIIWKKQMTHPVAVPLYRSITCSGDAVFLAYDSYDYSNLMNFGVDRLDLATGKQVWSNRYTNSNSVSERINKVISINDTVYLFINNINPGPFVSQQNSLMMEIDRVGNVINSRILQGDNIVSPNIYYQWDVSPPTVTLTPDFDFVMTHQVVVGTDTCLNVCRFTKDGTRRWSKNFSGMKTHTPYNIHPQANGFLITGTTTANHAGIGAFDNCFLLKVDSIGEVVHGATGDCAQTDRTFTQAPATVSITYPAIEGVVDLGAVTYAPLDLTMEDIFMDATQFCNVQGNCGVVSFKQRGRSCSLTDTLVYFLENASNCDAAATWVFDPVFFKPGVINSDSIELIPLQRGMSTLMATVEGNCSVAVKNITTSIGHGADQLDLGKDTIICRNGDVKLSAGPGYSSYLWNDNSTDSFLVATMPGKYFVNIADNCGGNGSDTILVKSADSLFHVTGDMLSCNQQPATLRASKGYGNYQWSPSYAIQVQGDSAKVNPATTTIYQVVADKWPGCLVTATIQVTALTSPVINLGADTSLCIGDSLSLNAGNLFSSYRWSTEETANAIFVMDQGVYSVSAIFSNGCRSEDTIKVLNHYPKPEPVLNQNPVLCEGTERTLDAGQFNMYLWNDGSTGESFVVRNVGKYWVSVQDEHGCKGSDTTVIKSFGSLPAHFLPPDTAICQYGNLTIETLEPFNDYVWSDRSSGTNLTVHQPGLYWLDATDNNGCVGRDSIVLVSKQCTVGLYVPNAFTPNGDGNNDRFRPMIFGNLSFLEFVVFNRWGAKVYETRTPLQGWDGTINGVAATPGTYVWYCKYRLEGEAERLEKGTVILIR